MRLTRRAHPHEIPFSPPDTSKHPNGRSIATIFINIITLSAVAGTPPAAERKSSVVIRFRSTKSKGFGNAFGFLKEMRHPCDPDGRTLFDIDHFAETGNTSTKPTDRKMRNFIAKVIPDLDLLSSAFASHDPDFLAEKWNATKNPLDFFVRKPFPAGTAPARAPHRPSPDGIGNGSRPFTKCLHRVRKLRSIRHRLTVIAKLMGAPVNTASRQKKTRNVPNVSGLMRSTAADDATAGTTGIASKPTPSGR